MLSLKPELVARAARILGLARAQQFRSVGDQRVLEVEAQGVAFGKSPPSGRKDLGPGQIVETEGPPCHERGGVVKAATEGEHPGSINRGDVIGRAEVDSEEPDRIS